MLHETENYYNIHVLYNYYHSVNTVTFHVLSGGLSLKQGCRGGKGVLGSWGQRSDIATTSKTGQLSSLQSLDFQYANF